MSRAGLVIFHHVLGHRPAPQSSIASCTCCLPLLMYFARYRAADPLTRLTFTFTNPDLYDGMVRARREAIHVRNSLGSTAHLPCLLGTFNHRRCQCRQASEVSASRFGCTSVTEQTTGGNPCRSSRRDNHRSNSRVSAGQASTVSLRACGDMGGSVMVPSVFRCTGHLSPIRKPAALIICCPYPVIPP